MRQSACLVINPITVDNFAALFNRTPVDRTSPFDCLCLLIAQVPVHCFSITVFRLYDGLDIKLFILVGWDRSSSTVALSTGAQLMIFFCFRFPVVLDLHLSYNTLYLLSPRLCFFMLLRCDLCVYRDDSLTSYRVIMRTEQPTKCFVPLQGPRVRLCT